MPSLQGLHQIGLAALILVLIGRVRTIYIAEGFCFRVLIIAVFAILYPLSGFAHIWTQDSIYRGFFDLFQFRGSRTDYLSLYSYVVVAVGAMALMVGCGSPIRANKRPLGVFSLPPRSQTVGLIYSSVVVAVGAVATMLIYQQVDLSYVERGRVLESGTARFAFLSTWISWGLSYAYLILAFGRFSNSLLFRYIGLIVCTFLIGLSLYWTAGRAVTFLLSSPILIIALKVTKSRRFRWGSLLTYGGALAAYSVYLSLARTENYYAYSFSVLRLLDWEFGRYSMVAYAIDYASRNYLLLGESYIAAAVSVLTAPLGLLGIGREHLTGIAENVSSVIGQDILGDRELGYIVPGLLSEAFLNFGILGAACAMYLVGRLVRKIDFKLRVALEGDLYGSMLFAFMGSLVCLTLMSTTTFGFLSYLLFNGLPLLLGLYLVRRFRLGW